MSILPDPMEDPSSEVKQLYDELASQRKGLADGFYRVLLHYPELARHVAALGRFIRFEDQTLSAKVRETLVMATANGIGAHFVWAKHLEPSKDAGISAATLDAIRRNAMSEIDDPDLQVPLNIARDVVRNTIISDADRDAMVRQVGLKGFVESVVVAAFYRFVHSVNSALDVQLVKTDGKS